MRPLTNTDSKDITWVHLFFSQLPLQPQKAHWSSPLCCKHVCTKPTKSSYNSFNCCTNYQPGIAKNSEKSSVNNLRFLRARLCLVVRPSCFLLWVVLAFPAPETFDLDLTGGLVCGLKLSVSGLTIKPDRSGDIGNVGIFPVREARMVTWKENTTCIDL